MKQFRSALCVAAFVSAVSAAHAQSFWDGFDNNNFNPNIWTADSGRNGEPFGCTFYPSMITPGTGGYLNLTLHNGACAEMKTKALYRYGTIQTRIQYSNVPGTVASLFTYNSSYITPGNAWTEIDIEFLPSYPHTLHTNIIYQANPNAPLQQWEKYIDLSSYGVDPTSTPLQVGFDWSASSVAWYLFDSSGNKRYVRTVTNSGANCSDCVPQYAWPSNPANIYANYWHGDNSNSDSNQYFPKTYNYGGGAATYDWIQYIAQ